MTSIKNTFPEKQNILILENSTLRYCGIFPSKKYM